jgi:exodeoxyribonuclease V gamma subunit
LSLFSISNMPPIFLKFFYELSTVVDVNLFYLSPAEGFWGDIVEKRKLFEHEIDMDQYWESTNEFLALNCRLGQEFFLLLQDFEGEAGDVSEEYFEPIERDATTLLHSFQNDLLYMEESSFDKDCDSIVFSSCHSEVRELQVLYDYILHALNENPELQPSEILVMMPQIEKYAPYINAVFGHPESELLKIPFCLSDSKKSMTNDIASYLIKLIDLGQARVTAGEVMELLENEDIAYKFNIYDGDKELLSQFVLDTNVAWGVNRDFVEELCEVSFGNNNWQDCIHRWFSGYALSKDDCFFNETDILPYDIEGSSESILVGRFVSFLYKLFATIDELKSTEGRSPAEWRKLLIDMIDTFFARNYEKADYRNQVVQAIVNLELETRQVGFDGEISLSVVRDILYNSINSETTYAGFLQRGVTFCKLLPMRSVPAKVICLLGVNDGVFPRTDSFIDFDLMKFSRQIGERSARYEDRYLFLEYWPGCRNE